MKDFKSLAPILISSDLLTNKNDIITFINSIKNINGSDINLIENINLHIDILASKIGKEKTYELMLGISFSNTIMTILFHKGYDIGTELNKLFISPVYKNGLEYVNKNNYFKYEDKGINIEIDKNNFEYKVYNIDEYIFITIDNYTTISELIKSLQSLSDFSKDKHIKFMFEVYLNTITDKSNIVSDINTNKQEILIKLNKIYLSMVN